MLGKHVIFPFSSINYMVSVDYIFFAEYYIRFCNYYMFGVSSDSILTDICACYSNVDLYIKYILRNL